MSVAPEAKNPVVTVGEFYTRHSESLQMKLLGPALGFDRRIREPTINRPGLALSGFFSYFAERRIQVLGSAELSYLKSLPDAEVREPVPRAVRRPDSLPHRLAQRQAARRRSSRRPRLRGHRRLSHADGDDEVHQRRHAGAGSRFRARRRANTAA